MLLLIVCAFLLVSLLITLLWSQGTQHGISVLVTCEIFGVSLWCSVWWSARRLRDGLVNCHTGIDVPSHDKSISEDSVLHCLEVCWGLWCTG